MEPISASIAALCLLLGLALIFAGLFGDRSHGRRRCTSCGYAMDGLEQRENGRLCPECGRISKSERAMRGTRRRWGRVGFGLGVLVLAAGIAGWSRWDAAGVAALPDPVLIRLGLFSARALDRLMTRLIADTGHADPKRATFATRAIDRLALWVARPASGRRTDEAMRRRAVAARLGPLFAQRLLNDQDPARRHEAVTWCELLASRSIDAQHALAAAGADPDPRVAEASGVATGRGDWLHDGLVPDAVARQIGFGRMTWLGARIGPWIRSLPPTRETMLTLARHLIDPAAPGAEYLEGEGDAEAGVGILLSVLGPCDEAFAEILALADADAQGYRVTVPLRLFAAFDWRSEMGPPLLAAVAHEQSEVRDAGWDVLEHFGDRAGIRPESLLAVIRRPEVDAERRAPKIAMALGVPRETLREAGLGVLRAQFDAWRRAGHEPFEMEGRELSFGGGVVDWIEAVVEPGDEEAVALLRAMTFETEAGLGCRIAGAYLRLSGDGAGVTRFVLDAYAGEIADGAAFSRLRNARVSGALRSLLFEPGMDVDRVLDWIGTDPGRARRIAAMCVAAVPRSAHESVRANLHRLMTELASFESANAYATRMLERIREWEEDGGSEPVRP